MDQLCSSEPIKCVLLMEVESGDLENRAALNRKLYGVLPGPKICTLIAQLPREPQLGRHKQQGKDLAVEIEIQFPSQGCPSRVHPRGWCLLLSRQTEPGAHLQWTGEKAKARRRGQNPPRALETELAMGPEPLDQWFSTCELRPLWVRTVTDLDDLLSSYLYRKDRKQRRQGIQHLQGSAYTRGPQLVYCLLVPQVPPHFSEDSGIAFSPVYTLWPPTTTVGRSQGENRQKRLNCVPECLQFPNL